MSSLSTKHNERRSGFTIVELAMVIVVIAILALISIVAYNGVQNRAEDANIRTVAQQIVKAIQVWNISSGKRSDIGGYSSSGYSNGVCVGGNGGWFSRSVSYPCTMDRVLVEAGAIPGDLATSVAIANKKYKSSYTSFMLYPCWGGGDWVFMYALHTPDEAEITNIRKTCAGSPTATFGPIDTYGMTGGIIFSPQGGVR